MSKYIQYEQVLKLFEVGCLHQHIVNPRIVLAVWWSVKCFFAPNSLTFWIRQERRRKKRRKTTRKRTQATAEGYAFRANAMNYNSKNSFANCSSDIPVFVFLKYILWEYVTQFIKNNVSYFLLVSFIVKNKWDSPRNKW